jgi:lipoprotein
VLRTIFLIGCLGVLCSCSDKADKYEKLLVKECQGAGASKSQCKCSAKEIRKKYPAEEFENMMENIIRTGKIPESYWAAGREAAVKCILE